MRVVEAFMTLNIDMCDKKKY